tara:strand:+ start:4322 stop:5320 length:999 start_codon:yes stop_codon:yes gene_type:complete
MRTLKKLGIWFNYKFKPENEWLKFFDKLNEANISECFINANSSQLSYLISLSNNYNLNIHGWMWTLNRPYDAKSSKNLHWYSVNKNGQNSYEYRPYVDYYQWLSPFSEGAREYIKDNFSKIASIEGLSSVHLDYVRYCDIFLPINLQKYYKIDQTHEFPEYDFGYHPNGRNRFKNTFGVDPMDIVDAQISKEWKQFRCDAVSSLVKELKSIARNKDKKISAAVFPYPEMSREMVLQDWSSWCLDIICPMNYHHFYDGDIDWIADSVSKGIKYKKPDGIYLSGLFLGSLSPSKLKKAIRSCLNSGADGVCLFNDEYLTMDHINIIKSFQPTEK